jgi:long-subunit fatty acid transport protein
MIKKLIVPAFLFFTLISFAQQGTSSPYSFYGIGDVKFKGTAENRAMGGLTIYSDSIHLNFQNPASYTNLKLTTFSLGGTYLTTDLSTNSQSEKARRTAMDYLAVGLPLGKFGVGFGLMPYSSVGYNIQSYKAATATDTQEIKQFSGTGGINKVFFGVGYTLTKKWSLGLDYSYNFGKIETYSFLFKDGVQNGKKEKDLSNISGGTLTAGVTFNTPINKQVNGFASLTYSPDSKLSSANFRNTSTIPNYSTEEVIDVNVDDTSITLPSKLAVGFGIGQNKKWMLGTEITFQKSSNMGNRFNDINNVNYENATRYSLGGFFIPNYNSFSKYYQKIVYRGGLRLSLIHI